MKDVYKLEPTLIEKGEIKILGIQELYVNGIGVNTRESIVGVYKLLSSRCRANYDTIVKLVVDRSTTIGLNISGPNSKSNSPIFEMEDGKPDEFYHIASIEVNSIDNVPDGMVARIIAPSKYISFSCKAELDLKTKKPRKVNWDPLFSQGYRDFKRKECLGYKEKDYSLEVAYRSDGKTIDGYVLLIPVE